MKATKNRHQGFHPVPSYLPLLDGWYETNLEKTPTPRWTWETVNPLPWWRKKSHPCCFDLLSTSLSPRAKSPLLMGWSKPVCPTCHGPYLLYLPPGTCVGPHSRASIVFRVHPWNHSGPIEAGAPHIKGHRRPYRACLHPGCLTVSSTDGLPASRLTAVQKTG